ncbi:Uncharacterised protein [Mycobacteroides abscessus subsp. abscessus]|nr:Uncharacterised protein [Mycobacteroides abscessus subsp. abscessus]
MCGAGVVWFSCESTTWHDPAAGGYRRVAHVSLTNMLAQQHL